jgi:hypothetical protein
LRVHEVPSVISERALALSLRLRIAELDDDMRVAVGSSAIPDRSAVAPDASAAWIYGAYAVLLSRVPDKEGLAGLRRGLEAGLPPTALLHELRGSQEGRRGRARLPADPRDVFVIGCHLLVFGRSPSPSELAEARSALDHDQSQDDYLATLAETDTARRALRSPPASPDRNAALAVAIQRATGHAEVDPVTARLRADLVAGKPLTLLLHGELDRHASSLLARIRVRLVLQSMVAHAEGIAASLLAQQESALTRDLIWRIKLDEWQKTSSFDET